jgi:phenylalanyl-tRNA synthetase alpha chain
MSAESLRLLSTQFDRDKESIADRESLEEVRIRYLSRKSGRLTLALQTLPQLPKEQRRDFGQAANRLKQRIEAELTALEESLDARSSGRTRAAALDVTLPGFSPPLGHRHPITLAREEMERIFVAMGYTVEEGPEVETTYYNFEALNIPEGHPARNDSDTFYVSDSVLLRTHTSPVQVRTMEKQQPPIRIVCPGRVFRRDDLDATHSPMFHQFEGLVVDEGITFGDLKGTLELFHSEFFGPGTQTRFRPSYFPFTEPSAEVDISCIFCGQKGCRVCKQTGWIELGGSGMVNPALYGFVDYDPEKYTGFAFGGGIDRYAMVKYQIDDIPTLFQNDLRFLQQFR